MTVDTHHVVTGIVGGQVLYAYTPAEYDELSDQVVSRVRRMISQVYVWDRPCQPAEDGGVREFPGGRLLVSVDPFLGWGALRHVHPGVPGGEIAYSYDPAEPNHAPGLILEPGGLDFPHTASLPLDVVRQAVAEYMRTGARPTCVEWQPGEWY